ncbi:SDR family NAD(P)-dependent oxidoreductase [Acuticoccus sediminis]|uniref:SDR family NAD(P)-dependent oxidoreductase n=1 Tax=Acuticoccus sediminis TaxID=2184697 RepID=UPI001CFCC5C0|nr:SDR family oxidoreductase [Acuticoccus sediminis]
MVLVTGGSRGIGAAIVRGAAARGHRVAFSYVTNAGAATALVDEIAAAGGIALAIQADVADPSAPARLFDAAEALDPVTALVNNAGVTGRLGRLADLPLDALCKTIDTNLTGTILMAQEAVRRWEATGTPGRMVNISSVAATLGAPGEYVHYAATKAAVEAFTIGLGKEVAGRGIRVNAVSPGTTMTEIHAAGGNPDRPAQVAPRVPLGRVAEPEEIAAAVLWLLTDEASYVAGTVLRVGGGV